MKKYGLLSLLLLVALPLLAQSTCPVQPTLVKNISSRISIDFQNTSGKQLASYRFGLTFFGNNGEAHAFPQPLVGRVSLNAHRHRAAIWETPSALQFLYPVAEVYLKQATFTDGTIWNDDGSKTCKVTSIQE